MIRRASLWLPALALAAVVGLFATGARAQQSRSDAFTRAFEAIGAGKIEAGLAMRNAIANPVARDIVTWYAYTRKDASAKFADVTHFIRYHDDWPLGARLQATAEASIDARTDPAAVEAWFAIQPPRSFRGLRSAVTILLRDGRTGSATSLIRRTWTVVLHRAAGTERSIHASFKNSLTQEDHYERVSALLNRGRVRAARRLLGLIKLESRYQEAVDVRMQMASRRTRGNVNLIAKALKSLAQPLAIDEGIRYARLRWYRRLRRTDQAVALLRSAPKQPKHPKAWWEERDLQIRAALTRGDHKLAYTLAASHRQHGAEHHGQAEFMAGWIALRFLKKPEAADSHFIAGAEAVEGIWSRARFSYWRGRVAEERGNLFAAQYHYAAAARFGTTFYGQLASGRLGLKQLIIERAPKVAPQDADFWTGDMVQGAALLARSGQLELARVFAVQAMLKRARSAHAHDFLARWVTREMSSPSTRLKTGVRLVKYAQFRGFPLISVGYPTIDLPARNTVEPALVYALIRQESEFHVAARSWVGARGLMQLMHFTARAEARGVGLPYALGRLTQDASYNLRLGTNHMAGLLEQLEGAYPLALAGYNAGVGRVNRWLAENGDPRKSKARDWIDWIEMIPFEETRNYTKRVLEALPLYRLKLGERVDPKRLIDRWIGPQFTPAILCKRLKRRPPNKPAAASQKPPSADRPPAVVRGKPSVDTKPKPRGRNRFVIEMVRRKPHDNVPGEPDCG